MDAKTLLWEKQGKGWTMQLWHDGASDKFAIVAQLESGSSNGWMGLMSRKEAAGLAEALTSPVVNEEVVELARQMKVEFGSSTGMWTKREPEIQNFPRKGLEEMQKDLGDAINKVPVPELGPIRLVITVLVETFTKSSVNVFDLLAAYTLLEVKRVAPLGANWAMLSDPDMSDTDMTAMTGPVRNTVSYYAKKPCANDPSCLLELAKIPDKELVIPKIDEE